MPDDSLEPATGRSARRVRWGARLEREHSGIRYGIVLLLLLVTFVFMASGPTGSWVPLVTVVLQGTTLLAALAASEANPKLVRISVVVIAVGLVSGVGALFASSSNTRGLASVLSFLLAGVAPVAIVSSIVRRRVIDVQTVLGAICVYVLFGMAFSSVFTSIGAFGSSPFFAQVKHATTADYLYFSFVTLCTVGYGDLTAAGGLGRATAVLEALLGQLYLVTVLALLVSQLGLGRGRRESAS
ncbi:MAG: potassium channel family protein [Acidimicrobiia bacterium]